MLRRFRRRRSRPFAAGETLASSAAVAHAVERLPPGFPREVLLYSLALWTGDGHAWFLDIHDTVLWALDLSNPGTDAFESALAAAAWTGPVERVERDAFTFTTPEPLPVDVVLARCVDICGDVFRTVGPAPP